MDHSWSFTADWGLFWVQFKSSPARLNQPLCVLSAPSAEPQKPLLILCFRGCWPFNMSSSLSVCLQPASLSAACLSVCLLLLCCRGMLLFMCFFYQPRDLHAAPWRALLCSGHSIALCLELAATHATLFYNVQAAHTVYSSFIHSFSVTGLLKINYEMQRVVGLVDRKFIGTYFDNQWIDLVIIQAKMISSWISIQLLFLSKSSSTTLWKYSIIFYTPHSRFRVIILWSCMFTLGDIVKP